MGLVGLLDDCIGHSWQLIHDASNSFAPHEAITFCLPIILLIFVYTIRKRKLIQLPNDNSVSYDVLMQPKENALDPLNERPPFSDFSPTKFYLGVLLLLGIVCLIAATR
jgi:hypothetical protein